jgi:hypothetical protein
VILSLLIAIATGILAGLVTFLIAERRLASDNIIQERRNWREHIRELAEQGYKAILSGEVAMAGGHANTAAA